MQLLFLYSLLVAISFKEVPKTLDCNWSKSILKNINKTMLNHEEYISNMKTRKTNASAGPSKLCWVELISIVEILLNSQIKYVTYSDFMCTKFTSGYFLEKNSLAREPGVLGYIDYYISYCQITHWLSDLYISVSCVFSQCESSNTSD